MRKFTLTIAMMMAMVLSMFAQVPQTMSYQAVVRNAENALVASQSVSIELSILQGSDEGTAVYTETHNATTNANGLVTLELGAGETSDNFSTIDWSAGPYFVKTVAEIDGNKFRAFRQCWLFRMQNMPKLLAKFLIWRTMQRNRIFLQKLI